MKNFRKIRKNVKALSPVVASIILIAVTVAVSIAVAAWMGALTVGFMGTEELKITNMQFTNVTTVNHIIVIANNTGTSPVTINEVWVNGVKQAYNAQTVPANAGVSVDVYTTVWVAGSNYQVKLISSKGTTFLYNGIAPS
jgi:flagellin-like protein